MIGGYVYIFKRKRSDLKARRTLQRQYKIGISENVDRRERKVNKAVPGGIKRVDQYWFFDPRSVEKLLHSLFKTSRRKLRRAKTGAGHTEWFDLHILELFMLRVVLFGLWSFKLVAAFALAILLMYFYTGAHLAP
jgi:hypothetical protein